jgi:iron uptake system EfeUOB component EfeO/EfeM
MSEFELENKSEMIYINEDVNIDARIKYITKEYDDKKFTSVIHKNNKAIAKKQDIFNVIQLQHQGVTDIVFRMVEALKPTKTIHPQNPATLEGADFLLRSIATEINTLYKEFETLTRYSNDLLHEHRKTYQCKLWRLRLLPDLRRDVFN